MRNRVNSEDTYLTRGSQLIHLLAMNWFTLIGESFERLSPEEE